MQPEIPLIFLRRTMCEALLCDVILRKQVNKVLSSQSSNNLSLFKL
jgi:hypothetical protein